MVKKQNSITSLLSSLYLHLKQLLEYEKNPEIKKWFRRFIFIGWMLFLLFIIWGGWKFRDQLIPYLSKINVINLLIGLFFFLVAIGFIIFGWMRVMNFFAPGIKLWTHIYIYCATIAGRRAPGTLWYIGGRIPLYKKWGASPVNITIASSIEIILIIISGSINSLIFLPFGLKLSKIIIILLIVGIILGGILLHPTVIAKLLTKFKQPLPKEITYVNTITWVIPYMLTWIAGGLMFYYIGKAFYPLTSQNLIYILGAWSTAGVAGYLTILLPSSFGVTDISLAAFMTVLVPIPLAIVIALSNRLLTAIVEFFISFFFFYVLRDRKIESNPINH